MQCLHPPTTSNEQWLYPPPLLSLLTNPLTFQCALTYISCLSQWSVTVFPFHLYPSQNSSYIHSVCISLQLVPISYLPFPLSIACIPPPNCSKSPVQWLYSTVISHLYPSPASPNACGCIPLVSSLTRHVPLPKAQCTIGLHTIGSALKDYTKIPTHTTTHDRKQSGFKYQLG